MRSWVAFFFCLMLANALFVEVPEAEARVYISSKYRRYRAYRHKRNRYLKSQLQIKIRSVKVRGAIESKKLQRSIKNKLKKISGCIALQRRAAWERKNPSKQGRRRTRFRAASPLPPLKKQIFSLQLIINGFGRALKTTVLTKKAPLPLKDCFVWFMKGKRYFPPESQKKVRIRVAFAISQKSPPKPTRRTFRRRTRRW